MTELTEQQEKEMIEKAKTGDPEANYNMSLWALEQAMAEPDEQRWNRLAAKCLVKSAEAGYAPAKAKMDELLHAAETKTAARQKPAGSPSAKRRQQTVSPASGDPSSVQLNKVAEQAGDFAKKAGKAAAKAGSALASGASALSRKARTSIANSRKAKAAPSEDAAPGGSHTSRKDSILPDFSQWDDAKWKKLQIACIVICVILAILISVLIISGRRGKKDTAEDEALQIPTADIAATPEADNTPGVTPAANGGTEGEAAAVPGEQNGQAPESTTAPAPSQPEENIYPSQAERDEISAARLEVYPGETDYVDSARNVTVNTPGGGPLNLRSGPSTNNSLVGSLPNGTQLPVYANKNGWALVKYNGTWGWCSYDYLKS